ncbi:MAG TPA: D-glucuronyl C5-epimerase family protein [Gaiellaceae bacterium]|nr:D-glucuronyl C5-epimerase family protein [Gaiellaceae bacterium]
MKPAAPSWPPDWLSEAKLHVAITQWGLGCYEHYLADGEEAWLAAAIAAGDHLLVQQTRGGRLTGGFVHDEPYPHTFHLPPPWLSGITQGQAASLFVRLHQETGEPPYAEAARLSLAPLARPTSEGGVQVLLDGLPVHEEYPTEPPSYVLNGGLFALFGLYDAGLGLSDAEALAAFEETAQAYAQSLHRWDLGYWSRYDLYPHPLVNVASSSYHHLHISQLDALARLSPLPQFPAMRERFRAYERSRRCRGRAFAGKVRFRLAVSRRRAAGDAE